MTEFYDQKQRGILDGCLVLDLAQLITGPWCASLLGDMGAEVIKIESPRGGESLRHIGPFIEDESTLFLSVNRNKKGMTLALEKSKGREVLEQLIEKADVVIQNFRPDIRRAYGLHYERVRELRPEIIYLSVTAFGEKGPYRLKAGTDHVFQGCSGLMSVSGEPEQGPLRLGVPAADMTTAIYSCMGVLAALLHRQKTGRGQEVRVNLLDTAMSLQQTTITEYLLRGRPPEQTGNSSPFASPVCTFPTADGYVNVAAFNNKFWRGLCGTIGKEALVRDPRFKGPEERMAHRKELEALLAECFITRSTDRWLEILDGADVPCGPVHDYETLFKDPQVAENHLMRNLPHGRIGSMETLGNPLGFSLTPAREKTGAPGLGEHTDEILLKLGLSSNDILTLREQGII